MLTILNQWHAWFFEAQELREFNAAAEAAAAAIEALQAVLPTIGMHHQKMAHAGNVFARWQLQAVSELHSALRKDPARVAARDSLPDHRVHVRQAIRSGVDQAAQRGYRVSKCLMLQQLPEPGRPIS